jgi:Flp pilus assembly protein TadG
MLIALGTEGPRYLTEKARLSDVLEQASLALTAEDNNNTVEDMADAVARNEQLVTRYIDTLMPRRHEGKSAENIKIDYSGFKNSTPGGGASYIEYRVKAQSPHLSWFDSSIFPAFDKEVSVGEGGAARKYSGGLDVMFVLDFSGSMVDPKNVISGSSTRLAALKESLAELVTKVTQLGSANQVGVIPFDWGTVDVNGDCRVYLKLTSDPGNRGQTIEYVHANKAAWDGSKIWDKERYTYKYFTTEHFFERPSYYVAGQGTLSNHDLLNDIDVKRTIDAITDVNERWEDILIPKKYYRTEYFPELERFQCFAKDTDYNPDQQSAVGDQVVAQSFPTPSAMPSSSATNKEECDDMEGMAWSAQFQQCSPRVNTCRNGDIVTAIDVANNCDCAIPRRDRIWHGMCLRTELDGEKPTAWSIPLTNEGDNVINGVNKMTAEGNTFIAPAMIEGAVSLIREGRNSRQVLVVISDGEDFPNEKVSQTLINAGLCEKIRDGLTTKDALGKLVFIGIGYDPVMLPQWEDCVGKENIFFPETLDQLKESLHRAVFEEVGRNTIK